MSVDSASSVRGRPWDLWGPPVLFVLFVGIGCGFIILAKNYHLRQEVITFVPVAIMFLYALTMLFARVLRLKDDQAGDNLYYMGFLFTLTSLGSSLYQFSTAKEADYIVQNFGIAIASTIAGIALRVLFNQMRRDPAEVERTARLELADAAKRVRTELDHTVLEFNHFRRSSVQSMREGFDDITKNVEAVSVKILSSLEEVATKSSTPLNLAAKSSSDLISDMTKAMVESLSSSANELAQESSRLARSASGISDALENVSKRLAEMQSPNEVIQIKLDPTIKALAAAVDRFSKRVSQLEIGREESVQAGNLNTERIIEKILAQAETVRISEIGFHEALKHRDENLQGLLSQLCAVSDQNASVSDRSQESLLQLVSSLKAMSETFQRSASDQASILSTALNSSVEASKQQISRIESMSELMPAIEQKTSAILLDVRKLASVESSAVPAAVEASV